MAYFISVVIAAHNRNDSLKNTLNSLLIQDYSKNNYEIIVVGYDKNDTKKVITLLNNPLIKYFEIDSTYPDKKRNYGIKQAKGKIIAFTDDDCLPQIDWISRINSAFELDKTLSGIEGKTTQDNQWIFYHASENLIGGKFLACNYAFKKEALLEIGGFDENYGFFREDTDLAFRLLSAGKKIKFDKKVLVHHPPRKGSYFSKVKELFLLKGDIRLYKKFPELYKKNFGVICKGLFKQSIFSWIILSALFFSIFTANLPLLLSGMLLLFLFRFFIEAKNKEFCIGNISILTITCFLRDLFFPFFFVYYYISINQSKFNENTSRKLY
ncbi:MAG: glycosyltransferase family 2 protein [archaeon]